MPERNLPTAAAASTERRKKLIPVAILLVVGSLLGLSTNLAKLAATRGLNTLTLLIWAMAGATLVVSAVNLMRGRGVRPTGPIMEYFLVSALVGVAAPNMLMYAAVPHVGAGFVTLTIAFPPLLTYLGSWSLRMERFQKGRALGVLLALGGAAYLAVAEFSRPDAPVLWLGAALVAPVLLAVGNIYRTARWPEGVDADQLVPGVLLAGSLMLVGLGVVTDVPLALRWQGGTDYLLIGLQTAVLSLFYLLFFELQRRGGPILVSLLGSVATVVGVPAAIFLLGEEPPAGLFLGAVLIAGGIILVFRGQTAPRESGAASLAGSPE